MTKAKHPALATALVFALAASIAGCVPPSGPDNGNPAMADTSPVLATVNGRAITENTFNVYAQNRAGGSAAEISAEQRTQLLDDIINLYAMAGSAQEQGLASNPKVMGQIELQRQGVLAQTLVEDYVSKNPVSDEEVQAEFQARVSNAPDTEYKASHILLENEEDAIAVIAALDAGGDFAELAKEKSTGPSGPNGGDLGWFAPSQMVKPFADAVAAMETGSHSKAPVQTQFGWHVIKAESTRDLPAPSLEELREQIVPGVQQRKVQNYIEAIRASAEISRKDSPAAQ